MNLNIEDDENEEFVFDESTEEQVNMYETCLGGRFLMEKNINTRSAKMKLVHVWKPTMSINIKELEPRIFLFQFYYKEDLYLSDE